MKITITVEQSKFVKKTLEIKSQVTIPAWLAKRITDNCDVCLYEFENNDNAIAMLLENNKVICIHERCQARGLKP